MLQRSIRSDSRAPIAIGRLRDWLDESHRSGITLTKPGSVAWVTGGKSVPVDRSAPFSDLWAVVTRDDAVLIASEVEVDRILAEYSPRSLGFDEVLAVPWYDQDRALAVAIEFGGGTASDGHPGLGENCFDKLVTLRLNLSDPEQDDLRELGADVAEVVGHALRCWRPGQHDWVLQANLVGALLERGIYTPVMIVGGDERVRRFRHPLAGGRSVSSLAMVAVVAERGGLHTAITRYVTSEPLPSELLRLFGAVRRIEHEILGACRVGEAYSSVLIAMDKAYQHEGHAQEWEKHYQGGPIGFAQREFEISPANTESKWYKQRIETGTAVAWNPSLSGGAKVEDTYIVQASGLELVTTSSLGLPFSPGDDDSAWIDGIVLGL